MRGGDIAGLLIRQARLQRDWSQEGLCRGICAPSYLSKIEQGKAAPSPEVTELLLHRLGLVWTPEPEGLAPCWKTLLSGSPNFDSLYEQLVQPRREILASSPLAADALLLDAFYADEMRPLPVEWEPFLSTRQLALPGAFRAGGRRRYGWSRCRCWLPTTESSSTPRANTPPPSRCCGTPTARHRTPATPT